MRAFAPLESARTLSIMPTFRCTAACKNCGTLSGPADKTRLGAEVITRLILEAADSGYALVVFTGGEPTLAEEEVLSGLTLARAHGLRTRMVSNGWWASDPETAIQTIRRYRAAGLQELNLSTGDQHARFVTVENVIRAIGAGLDADLESVVLMVELVDERSVTGKAIEAHPLFELLVRPNIARLSIVESPWMPLAPHRQYRYPKGLAADRTNVASREGCDNVLTTTTIQADGRIGACCGLGMRLIPELIVGTVHDTSLKEADAAAADDFLKRWIHVEGPEKILAWAASIDPQIQWEGMYAHRCQACIRLYKDPRVRDVIAQNHQAKFADVIFGEWLLYHVEEAGVPLR